MTEKLKPCPFQQDGESHDVRFVEMKPGHGQVGCADCGFWLPSEEAISKEEAFKRWNTRAEPTCENIGAVPEDGSRFYLVPHFKCSECGSACTLTHYAYFCPNCGAKVVEE